ncbi:uncharacterized protein LDX57_002160 [Aspergillus melleus]|uniref:uncharacterized protein n=1 Tax=Aspergillus melleus TaxID=138277 RepID=UPI001E8E6380|nr:uncharacterized protein LDX57_002160 [Aspergillus melleus]KAH8424409.1 hypothetical protein LDX57_002160 [Aspergillus melleus]
MGGTALPPRLLDAAEELIFRQITNLSTLPPVSLTNPTKLLPTVQLIQSALIMEMLQFGQDQIDTRRRIRIIRHPCLVSVLRSLGFFQLRRSMTPSVCDDTTWREMVAEEACIRVASWVFLADGFLTVCFKNHPSLSSFELNCDFPWPTELWEADGAAAFSTSAASHADAPPIPPLREALGQLLSHSNPGDPIAWHRSPSVEHLLILIYGMFPWSSALDRLILDQNRLTVNIAMNTLAFQARAGFLGYLPAKSIENAARDWKGIWDSTIARLGKERYLLLGYPQHAEELWCLLTATLNASNKQQASIRYLDSAATDDLEDLHEFIERCGPADG